MKKFWLLAGLCFLATLSHAQIIKRIKDRAKRKAEQKVEQKIDKKIDKGIDDVLDGKKKADKKKDDATNSNDAAAADNNGVTTGAASLQTYSKFDFIPGEKVISEEDFSQDAVGDFPAKWNTNSTGEIVTVDGYPGKWLSVSKEGVFLPEFIKSLPENFTLQFDLLCNNDFNYYSTEFNVIMADLKSQKDFINWKKYAGGKKHGIQVSFHPVNASMKEGKSEYSVYENSSRTMNNKVVTSQFFNKTNNMVKVSIWRQKQRMRVYLNEEKIYDVPRAFSKDINYNSVMFMIGRFNKPVDKYLFSNIRLAVGAPDTRSKLITEGKFVTNGILFDVNSDNIKPESYGVLKDIAAVLNENASVRVKIIGHTDADGNDKNNMELSKKRALSVKKALASEFGIDEGRLETDGKGESQPADTNDTREGKANNRRVEFIKL